MGRREWGQKVYIKLLYYAHGEDVKTKKKCMRINSHSYVASKLNLCTIMPFLAEIWPSIVRIVHDFIMKQKSFSKESQVNLL